MGGRARKAIPNARRVGGSPLPTCCASRRDVQFFRRKQEGRVRPLHGPAAHDPVGRRSMRQHRDSRKGYQRKGFPSDPFGSALFVSRCKESGKRSFGLAFLRIGKDRDVAFALDQLPDRCPGFPAPHGYRSFSNGPREMTSRAAGPSWRDKGSPATETILPQTRTPSARRAFRAVGSGVARKTRRR